MKRIIFPIALVMLAASACTLSSGDPTTTANDTRPVDEQLLERLAVAHGAMQDASGARTVPPAQRYAQVAIDAIVGPRSRYGAPSTRAGSLLPPDSDALTDEPGLALRTYDTASEGSPLRSAVTDKLSGAPAGWRIPSERYDAVDRAVASFTPENNSIQSLPSPLERALAWALLAKDAQDIRDLHALAGNGAKETRTALDGLRIARAKKT